MIGPKSDATAAKTEMTAETRQIVLREIATKWSKFSDHDLSALKDDDDLINQVVARYGLEKSQAQRDVSALLKGRHI